MNEAEQLERYLFNALPAEERLLMEAKLLLNKELKDNLYWQKEVYAITTYCGRKKLKEEIEAVHKRMFSEKRFESFRQKISFIFKK